MDIQSLKKQTNKLYEDQDLIILIYDSTVFVEYKEGLKRITIDVAKKMVRERKNLTRELTYPVILDGKSLKVLDDDARKYFGTEESTEGISALALIHRSIFTKIIYNIFIGLTRPNIPTKSFTDEQNAYVWMKSMSNFN